MSKRISIGFTGTQEGMTTRQFLAVEALLEKLRPTEVHHGDCVGSDAQFHSLCVTKEMGLIHVHPPIIGKKRAWCNADFMHDPEEYLTRNHDIVDASDILIATPKGPEKMRSGTWATIRYAKRAHCRLFIVWPDGRVE